MNYVNIRLETATGSGLFRQHSESLAVQVFHGLESVTPPFARSVLTIGNFDGMHRAHQQILAQAGLFAARGSAPNALSAPRAPVVVLTFEPHPLTVVAPGKAPARLSTPAQKLRYLESAGADVVVIAKSEPTLLGLSAEEFVRRVIWERFQPSHIVEGPNFGFGKGRTGTPDTLRHCATEFGCIVHIMEPVMLQIDGEHTMVSSSVVRRLLTDGKVREAAMCLGKPYALTGTVVEGERRGRTIGFPTANLLPADQLVPKQHVYAGRAVVNRQSYDAAISIGRTPTFGGRVQRVEAHLLDFDGDLYGQVIEFEFTRPLRPQQKFPSVDALVRQLHQDVRAVRNAAEQADPAQNAGRARAC